MKIRQSRQCLHFLAFLSSVIVCVRMIAPCQEAAGNTHLVRVFDGKCYEFVNTKASYDFAKLYCCAKGAVLVDLVDNITQEYLINTVKTELGLDWEYAYIGAWKDAGGGPWYGPYDNRISYSNWAPGQGGCSMLFQFMCIQNNAVLNFEKNRWEDVIAIDFNYYICQYGIHKKSCPFISGEHQNVKEFNGNCYEFRNDEKTHSNAEGYCAGRGAYLVEISDTDTENFLLNTIKTLQYELQWQWYDVYIGAFRVDGLKPWRWKNYKQLSYSNWGDGYCGNGYTCSFQKCAVLDTRRKSWNDVLCTDTYQYICQYKLPGDKKNSETSTELPGDKKNSETSTEFSTELKADISVETSEGIIYTVIAGIVSAFAGTIFVYQVYYRIAQVIRIRKTLLKGTATSKFWGEIMAEYYAFTIPDFDGDEERRLFCLNIPPQDFQYIIS